MPFGVGAHPYVRAGRRDTDDCVLTLAAASSLPLQGGLPTGPARPDPELDFRAGRPLRGLELDHAFGDCAVTDGKVRHRLTGPDGGVELWADPDFGWVQVFTPGGFPDRGRAVAVEPMTCPPDALNSGLGLLTVAPGESWTGSWGLAPALSPAQFRCARSARAAARELLGLRRRPAGQLLLEQPGAVLPAGLGAQRVGQLQHLGQPGAGQRQPHPQHPLQVERAAAGTGRRPAGSAASGSGSPWSTRWPAGAGRTAPPAPAPVTDRNRCSHSAGSAAAPPAKTSRQSCGAEHPDQEVAGHAHALQRHPGPPARPRWPPPRG